MDELQPDLLASIVAATRTAVHERERLWPLKKLLSDVKKVERSQYRFWEALNSLGETNVIAECKRRSPSRGILHADYHPGEIAKSYQAHGAVAISVLTEPSFFGGSLEHLVEVRSAVTIPILRKDFIVNSYQIFEAAAAGADAVLLIVAALQDDEICSLSNQATELGMSALVEVHDESELERALAAGASIIGVNNRNLRTLKVDLTASRRLIKGIPPEVVAVAESGLRTSSDLVDLSNRGYRAFLIGERLMTTDDPGVTLGKLLAGRPAVCQAQHDAISEVED